MACNHTCNTSKLYKSISLKDDKKYQKLVYRRYQSTKTLLSMKVSLPTCRLPVFSTGSVESSAPSIEPHFIQ